MKKEKARTNVVWNLPPKELTILTRQIKTNICANSADLNKTAHENLHCLTFRFFVLDWNPYLLPWTCPNSRTEESISVSVNGQQRPCSDCANAIRPLLFCCSLRWLDALGRFSAIFKIGHTFCGTRKILTPHPLTPENSTPRKITPWKPPWKTPTAAKKIATRPSPPPRPPPSAPSPPPPSHTPKTAATRPHIDWEKCPQENCYQENCLSPSMKIVPPIYLYDAIEWTNCFWTLVEH